LKARIRPTRDRMECLRHIPSQHGDKATNRGSSGATGLNSCSGSTSCALCSGDRLPFNKATQSDAGNGRYRGETKERNICLGEVAELNLQAEMGSLKTASAWHPDWHVGALTAISANGGLFRLPVKSTRILKKSRNSTHYLPID
jgi:hypothetical protein